MSTRRQVREANLRSGRRAALHCDQPGELALQRCDVSTRELDEHVRLPEHVYADSRLRSEA